jgi:serine/threonine protein kinase
MAATGNSSFLPFRIGNEFKGITDDDFRKTFRKLERIGEGSFGPLVKVQDLTTRGTYAMETVSPDYFQDLVGADQVVSVLKKLRKENGDYVVMTEFLPDGELSRKIRPEGGLKDKWDVQDTFRQIVDAVKFCHEHDVAHLDVKPDNIWCKDKEKKVKLANIGLAMEVSQKSLVPYYTTGVTGYKAPEFLRAVVNPWHRFTPLDLKAVDVWALGVTFYVMLTGRMPWRRPLSTNEAANSFCQMMYKHGVKDMCIALPATVDEDAEDLIRHMLELDPSKRYTIEEVAGHPYFKPRVAPPKRREQQEVDTYPYAFAQFDEPLIAIGPLVSSVESLGGK